MIGENNGNERRILHLSGQIDPATTGFPTLAAYLSSVYKQGYGGVNGGIFNFEELAVKDWGYGISTITGETGGVWNVIMFRTLTTEFYWRTLNVDNGAWITPKWDRVVSMNDLDIRDYYNMGTNGDGLDFNTVKTRNLVYLSGNFTAAKNGPPGLYGDASFISTNHGQIVFQKGKLFWFRSAAWNHDAWEDWSQVQIVGAKPQEQPLPLAEGWTAGHSKTTFSISNDRLVHINFGVVGPPNTSDRAVIATLPPEACPDQLISKECLVTVELPLTRYPAGLDVNTAGDVIVFSKEQGWTIAVGEVSFYAKT